MIAAALFVVFLVMEVTHFYNMIQEDIILSEKILLIDGHSILNRAFMDFRI